MKILKSASECISGLLMELVGVVPTDTIYGISTLAFSKEGVENIYKIKQRDLDKPFITLLSDISDLDLFQVFPSEVEKHILDAYWPGAYSIIFEGLQDDLKYLHRGKGSLAFRLPDNEIVQEVLRKTGPLVSTSVNLSGQASLSSLEDLSEDMKDQLDFFYDVGPLTNPPSRLLKIDHGEVVFLR